MTLRGMLLEKSPASNVEQRGCQLKSVHYQEDLGENKRGSGNK